MERVRVIHLDSEDGRRVAAIVPGNVPTEKHEVTSPPTNYEPNDAQDRPASEQWEHPTKRWRLAPATETRYRFTCYGPVVTQEGADGFEDVYSPDDFSDDARMADMMGDDFNRMDGELYWAPGRRGNVPALCVATQERRTFHPFSHDGGDRLPVGVSADSTPAALGPFGEEPSC